MIRKGSDHDRVLYCVPKDLVEKIKSESIKHVTNIESDSNDYDPSIAIDPGFMAILMQGYFSSPFVDKNLKDELLDMYMALLTFSYDDNDELGRAYKHGKHLITDGDRIRFLLLKAKEMRKNNGSITEPTNKEILDVGGGEAC